MIQNIIQILNNSTQTTSAKRQKLEDTRKKAF